MTVFAIVVLYHPKRQFILSTINSLLSQVEKIILVDNTESNIKDNDNKSNDIKDENSDFCNIDKEKIIYIPLYKNTGIAHAQNVGIEKAKEVGAEWVLFSDQDTVYPKNYIAFFQDKILQYGKRIIYTPIFYNNIKKQLSPITIGMKKYNYLINTENTEPKEVFEAISSGMLVNLDTVIEIGPIAEELFIDYVDFLWCWQARSKGIKILCFPDIVINHNLGDAQRHFLWKKVTIRSDTRYYYMIRNGLYLAKTCKYLTKKEKQMLKLKTITFIIGVVLISKNKIKAIKLMHKAIKNAKGMEKDKNKYQGKV